MLLTYTRAAVGALPLSGLIPVVGRAGGEDTPSDKVLSKTATADAEHLRRYAEVCGFEPSAPTLPLTYPHILAFGMQMDLMTDRHFPVPALGLVHIANTITRHRQIARDEELELTVGVTPFQPHPKGRAFSLTVTASSGGEVVWEELSTNLARGKGTGEREQRDELPTLTEREVWAVPESLGRQYGGASGDRNPIHLHAVTAKLFGFPRAIAHGMWTKARAVAALPQLDDAVTVDVRFVRPLLLPGRAAFLTGDGAFAVRSPDGTTTHLEGRVSRPAAPAG